MQFRILSAFLIFIGSYLPLAIILAVQDIPVSWWKNKFCNFSDLSNCVFNPFANPYYSITFLLVTLFSVLVTMYSFKKIAFPFDVEVLNAKPIPNDIINYVFPYVVSFMGISYSNPDKLLGFAVFLLWMFAITYKSGQIFMNPLLLMFGWRLYDVKLQLGIETREVRLLNYGILLPGKYKAQTIQDFYVIKESS